MKQILLSIFILVGYGKAKNSLNTYETKKTLHFVLKHWL
jgi:hypothetical protein